MVNKLSCLEGKELVLRSGGRNHQLSLAGPLPNVWVSRSTFTPIHKLVKILDVKTCMYIYMVSFVGVLDHSEK